MPDLQTAFYIVGIVFMSLMLIIMMVLVATVLVIRVKIVAIHKRIEGKLDQAISWAETGSTVFEAIKKVTHNQTK